jgi:hypothetical protein
LDGDGQPFEGSHDMSFVLYDAATDGAALWTEDQSAEFEAGYYSITLGEEMPLDDLLFASGGVWLEVSIDGQALAPRQEVVSVPYALRATAAEHLEGGLVDAQEISVDGAVVIDAAGNWVGPTPSIGWGDLAGIPADIADGDQDEDTLGGLPCAAGAVAKFDGNLGLWACASDADSFADLAGACLAGDIPVRDNVAGGWICGPDNDTQLSETQVDGFVANNGYSMGAHTVDTDTQLSDAQVDAFVTNGPISLHPSTTLDGAGILSHGTGLLAGDIAWLIQHGAANAGCAAASPVGDSSWHHIVIPHEAGKTCTNSCAQDTGADYTNCRTSIAIGSLLRTRATSYGEVVGRNYNYGCNDSQNSYDEVQSQGLTSSYTAYCCCYR